MKNKIFISIYRFDSELKSFVDANYHDSNNTFVSLFELKNNGIKKMIRECISYRKYDEVVIVFNDENYRLLEPLLYVLSLFIFKGTLTRILPDKNIEKIPFRSRIGAVFRMIFSALDTKRLQRKVYKDMHIVAKQKRVRPISHDTNIFYLKTNLSFGTKAGGSLGHISGVVNALAKQTNITYISAETPVMIDNAVATKRIDLRAIAYSIPYELNSLKINEAFLSQVEKEILRNKPDAIYTRLTLFNSAGAYLANKYRIPLIVEYNGSEVWVQNHWGAKVLTYADLAMDMEVYVLKSADLIVTVSQVLKDELIERGFDEKKIVFYPNCIDPNIYNYTHYSQEEKLILREKFGFSPHDKIFTFIGTFGAWHGVEFLANAIVRLIDEHKEVVEREKIKFLLIGDGLLGQKVREILSSKEIQPYVVLTGLVPQEEAPKYLSISDCFLSPHIKQNGRFIGSPTKLFEYMAFAKPIIASNLDQVGEIFEHKLYAKELDKFTKVHKESAIVYEPSNEDEFIQSILFAAQSDLRQLGENAYKMVMEKYTWDVHVKKIVDKYNKVVTVCAE